MARRDTTSKLIEASVSYLLRKRYSCHIELGLTSWGKLRGDVVAVNLKAEIIIAEIKSCKHDYTCRPLFWQEYLKYSNKLYLCFSHDTYQSLKETIHEDIKNLGVGVLVLNPTTGYLDAKAGAKRRAMNKKIKKTLLIRMAWRSGISKRNSRRKRIFLT